MSCRLYSLIFSLFIPVVTFSQELEGDTIFYDRSWHETSNKESAGYFRVQKLEDTLYHFWDYYTENVQLQNEGYYHEDTKARYGLYTWYHKSGKKSLEGDYENNQRIGYWKSWYKNGHLKSEGLYKENNRIEEWSWYYQDGSKQSLATYVDNNIDGKRTWWHKSGKIKQVGFFDEGLKVNVWETYYTDGILSSKKNYEKGQLQGKQTTYYGNGKLRSSELYESGILKSEEWFNEAGEPVDKSEVTSLKDNYALFWKITGNGLKKPSYLLGTMHIKDKRAFEYSDSMHQAFEACEGYTMEILPDKFFKHNHVKPKNRNYSFDLGTELYSRKSSSYFYNGRSTHQDYWIQNVGALFHRDYFDPDGMPYFMDAYLYVKAGREGKFLEGLETVKDHLGTGSKLPSYKKNFDILSEFNPDKEMVNTYLEGDIDKIEAFMNFISSEEFNYWLLTVRNRKMANTIDSLAQIRSTFNTAGAAHLPGEEGIIQLLKEKGYTLTKVVSPFSKTPEVNLAETSKRKWQRINHEKYTIQVPSLTGTLIDKKQKWNICMDYLSEVAYAYALIEGKNVEAKSLLPKTASEVSFKKVSEYGEGISEYTYVYSGHKYTLLQLKKGTDHLFIRTTSLNKKPTLTSYKSDVSKIVSSVEWLEQPKVTVKKEWQTYDSEWFSFIAPGKAIIDTTVYSPSYYKSKLTSVVRHLFEDGGNQFMVRHASDFNSDNYDHFSNVAENTTAIYDSIFVSSPKTTEIDTLKKRLYLEYQMGNKIAIVQVYLKGYTTYATISVTDKLVTSQAKKFHESFKIKKLLALDFEKYQAPEDSFYVNFPDVEVDFKSKKGNYSSNSTVNTFYYNATDSLSKIKYQVISKKFKPYYQLKDTIGVMSGLYRIHDGDSLVYESATRLAFFRINDKGIKTRYQSIRRNRNVFTLKCSYPMDLEAYVDTNFFASLLPNWQKDSIDISSDKRDLIKEELENKLVEASEALMYNTWDEDDLDFLLSLKDIAMNDELIAENLVFSFNDSLQNDSASLLIYQLSKEHENLRKDAFWKVLKLRNPTSVWVIDSLTKTNFLWELEDGYGDLFSDLGDSVEYASQILFVLHKNETEENELGLINIELINYLDSTAYEYIPLQDSIISWTMDLITIDTLTDKTYLITNYLDFLSKCPSTDAMYDLFVKCTEHKNLEIRAKSMIYLLSNGKNANTDLVEKLLENRFYRFKILKILKEKKSLGIVPEYYLTQQAIVENQIYAENQFSYSDNLKLRFLDKKKVKVDGDSKLVYLFRLDVKSRKYVVLVGYQPKSKKEISFENDVYKTIKFKRSKDIPDLQKELLEKLNEPEEETTEEVTE